MSMQGAMSELKQYFRFPFQDRESRSRFALGCALMFAGYIVPILPGLLVYGYALQILRRSAQGEAPSMPAWEDWPGLLSLGFRGSIVQLAFTLPAVAVFLVGFGAYFGALIPFSIASSTDASVSDPAVVGFLAAMLILMLSIVFRARERSCPCPRSRRSSRTSSGSLSVDRGGAADRQASGGVTTSRPLYCPQCGQTRRGSLRSWQFGQNDSAGASSAS